jgi:Glycosyltransferase 61
MARNSAAWEVVATVCAETVSRRKLPVNFKHDDRALFDHEIERTIPPIQLLKFHDVRASAEGLLFTGARILRESFAFPDHLEKWKLRSICKFLATNYLFRRRREIDDEVLWITDYWSKAYFHWLTDVLTRLFVVRDRLDDLVLLLPAGFEDLEYVKSSLGAFAVPRVEFIRPTEVLHCRNLLLPTHTAPSGHYNEELIRGVREVLLSAYGEPGEQADGERIYISRHSAAKRRIVNEDEVTSILREFGFQTISAEELSFEQQVRTFSRARYIVSNHGAGLTNMLFMKEGGSVLELRHQADRINNCYFTLSSALKLNYFYQTCVPESHGPDPHTADLLVDPDKLEKLLALFGGSYR